MRLNKTIREEIVQNAVNRSGINERRSLLKKKMKDWIEKVRVEALGGEEVAKELESVQAQLEGIRKKYGKIAIGCRLKEDYDIWLNVAGRNFRAYFNGELSYSSKVHEFIALTLDEYVVRPENPLAAEFQKLEIERERIDKSEESLRADVSGIVYSVSSEKSLLKVWPEAKFLMPKSSAATANLPAIPVKDINARLGLPPEEEK